MRWSELAAAADGKSLTGTGTLELEGRPAVNGSGAFVVKPRTDFMGGDYRHFPLANASSPPSDCAAACEKEKAPRGRCVGWTWACPGMQGPLPVCWLKATITAAPKTDCATTGVLDLPCVPAPCTATGSRFL